MKKALSHLQSASLILTAIFTIQIVLLDAKLRIRQKEQQSAQVPGQYLADLLERDLTIPPLAQ